MPAPSATGHLPTTYLANRYHLLEPLGTGSMGTVFRANDLLAGQTVALKRVRHASMQQVTTELRLAFAREFQSLATLRHPHVIAVQDYGFDAEQQPYFTMELLPQAQPFTQQAQFLPFADKVERLLQLLQALVYIHRRGIIHRDLKPTNVLIGQQQVKVLDFGLATGQGDATLPSGTLAYMSPELLRGQSASAASDLYAVGVMAYELFAGWHPFGRTSSVTEALFRGEPDFSYLELPDGVTAVLQNLLAADPKQRCPDATAAIHALCQASGHPQPAETEATRESFLQAAPFIGREAELAQIKNGLAQAQAGSGSTWLVRGESGIGKTRLLQELRTIALVDGLAVLRGQAVTEGAAYHLWRDVLRQLVLLASPNALESAVLQPLVPDIAALTRQTVGKLAPLEAKAARTRLTLTVVDLFRRAAKRQPLLLILEDLHWAEDSSLFLLNALGGVVAECRLCVVASYRPGERPLLPQQLPHSHELALNRLKAGSLAELSAAMLGENGRQLELLRFLQQETEGNTFFMVEVLRSLAEEMGGLNKISALALPATIFPGGIQQIIQRRLDRIPPANRDLLRVTAVAGRQLDLRLMAYLAPKTDLEMWLTACANAAVLERSEDGQQWQFSHDKLREALLRQMPAQEQEALHYQIGTGIEAVHVDQLAPHYGRLAHHFGAARQLEPQRRYLRLAAQDAESSYANETAVAFYQQLLPLLADAAGLAEAHLQLAHLYRRIGAWEMAEEGLQAALEQAQQAGDAALLAEIYYALGSLARNRTRYEAAMDWLAQAQTAYRANNDQRGLCSCLVELANVYYQHGSYQETRSFLAEAMTAAQSSGDPENLALVQHNLGSVAYSQGQFATAVSHFEAALQVREGQNKQPEVADSYNNLGLAAFRQGNFDSAQAYLQKSLDIRTTIGDRWGMAASLSNLGMIPYQQQNYEAARSYWEAAVQIRRMLGEEWSLTGSLENLALVAMAQGDLAAAKALIDEAIQRRRRLNNRQGLAISLSNRGRLALLEQEWETAVSHYRESLKLAHEIGDQLGVVFALVGIAAGWINSEEVQPAVQLLAAAQQHLAAIEGAWETDEEALFNASCTQAKAILPAKMYEQAWQTGLEQAIIEVVQFAMEGQDDNVPV